MEKTKKIVSISPGKLIITGEHSVVYGEPALIVAIGLSAVTRVLGSRQDVRIKAINLGVDEVFEIDDLREYWEKALSAWQAYDDLGDEEDLRVFQKDPLVVVKCSLGMVLDELGVCGGFEVEISSDIPVGSGLGSSASVTSSVIGGLLSFYGVEFSLEELNEKTYEVEKIVQGNPSGGDNTAVVYGGGLVYQKIDDKSTFVPFPLQNISGHIALVNSGKPEETTGEMVGGVSSKLKSQSSNLKIRKTIKRMGEVSGEIISNLKNEVFDEDLIKENQRLLDKIGVVGKSAREIVSIVEKEGGVAKVCGAGGKKRGSGIMMIYHKDPDGLEYILKKLGKPIYKTKLGVREWYLEK